MPQAEEQRIPVLVVSGFLGSGKTTLVRHLLQAAQSSGTRVAVISNEFGALGIDKALLGEGLAQARLDQIGDRSGISPGSLAHGIALCHIDPP